MRHRGLVFSWSHSNTIVIALPSQALGLVANLSVSNPAKAKTTVIAFPRWFDNLDKDNTPANITVSKYQLFEDDSFFQKTRLSSEKNSTIAWTVAMKSKHRKNIWKNNVKADALSFVCFQSMAASQSGVHLDPAVLHVGLVSKFDFATAPILLRSTMALIVLGPAPKRTHVTMGHVQVDSLSFNLLLNKWM